MAKDRLSNIRPSSSYVPVAESPQPAAEIPLQPLAATPQSYGTPSIAPSNQWAASSAYSNTPPEILIMLPAENLDTFYKQVEVLTTYIVKIDQNVEQMGWSNKRLTSEVDPRVIQEQENRLETTLAETQELIKKTKEGVKNLKRSKRGDVSVRKSQFDSVSAKLMRSIKLFQTVQLDIKASRKSQIIRQYKIAKPDATNDEIEQAIESGRSDVFSRAMVSSSVSEQQRVLGEVEKRNQAIQRLAQSFSELVQLANEMNELIQSQQEFLDIIEVRVDKTIVNVEAGNVQLTQANESALGARNTQKIIAGVVVVVVVIIIIILVVKFAPAKK
ncbi:Plasma membrane t-SNARE, secretory vesicle fusion [Chytriomyces hyalinus]|nr:Plasma membrane t-SNARE, secretory vesicle fusion [Chytriomyces hyalinus]